MPSNPACLTSSNPFSNPHSFGIMLSPMAFFIERLIPRRGRIIPQIGLASDPARILWRLDVCLRAVRSEEHTSELQSRLHLVCRLLLEKKKNKKKIAHIKKAQHKAPTAYHATTAQ